MIKPIKYSARGNGCSRRGKEYKENENFQVRNHKRPNGIFKGEPLEIRLQERTR